MSRQGERRQIAAMDIGTSKIVTLIAELGEDDEIEIIGVGTHPSRGLKKLSLIHI